MNITVKLFGNKIIKYNEEMASSDQTDLNRIDTTNHKRNSHFDSKVL